MHRSASGVRLSIKLIRIFAFSQPVSQCEPWRDPRLQSVPASVLLLLGRRGMRDVSPSRLFCAVNRSHRVRSCPSLPTHSIVLPTSTDGQEKQLAAAAGIHRTFHFHWRRFRERFFGLRRVFAKCIFNHTFFSLCTYMREYRHRLRELDPIS